jgi:hypothetical protein
MPGPRDLAVPELTSAPRRQRARRTAGQASTSLTVGSSDKSEPLSIRSAR